MPNKEKIKFLEYQKPALEAGDYQIEVIQTINTGKGRNTYTADKTNFTVSGERFSLDPSDIHVMFPPPGSFGRYNDCVPHISIKRSTFPWERSAYGNEDFEPWLTLLLFDETEVNAGDIIKRTTTVGELNNGEAIFPQLTLETGQQDSDQVIVIDVKKRLLDKILPAGDDLKLLSHVRERMQADEEDPLQELAVVMGSRLPKKGTGSFVYLVSLEERYTSSRTFDYQTENEEDYIRLICFKYWSFSSMADEGKTFEELVEDISTGALSLPVSQENNKSENYLQRGYVPFRHTLRQGDKNYSWYRSPLSPQKITSVFKNDDDLPEFADALVVYHQDIGMFDTTYAAAYELGRVLAVEDNLFSEALYLWKQNENEKVALKLQYQTTKYLLTQKVVTEDDEDGLERKIIAWFKELAELSAIPFNYLIPDEKMLPQESIRFFSIDQHWLECLLYGAFTIGGNLRTDGGNTILESFKKLTQEVYAKQRSGFFVRSELVLDYPDLQVDTYSKQQNNAQSIQQLENIKASKLSNVRMERLANDILFYLVEGDMAMAELYLKPEGLYFGLDEEQADDGNGMKYEKDLDIQSTDGCYKKVTIELGEILKDKRVLKIGTLANKIQTQLNTTAINSAQFGMHMIEGSNKGRFVKSNLENE